MDGRHVGERLRAIRRQKGLSLHDVEARSDQEFKASVLGAYERGERAHLACRACSASPSSTRCPPTSCCPRATPRRRDRPHRAGAASTARGLHDRPRPAARDRRPRRARSSRGTRRRSSSQRQDFNGRMLTIRRDDLRVLAAVLGRSPEDLGVRLDELGLRAARPDCRSLTARLRAPRPSGRLRCASTCQHRRRPRSRSSSRATT